MHNFTREVNELIQRSWSPLINFMQTEDPDGYGTPMKPVRFYKGQLETDIGPVLRYSLGFLYPINGYSHL